MYQVPLPQRRWVDLIPSEQHLREKCRQVYYKVLSGMSLEAASRELDVHPETVLRHIDGFVKKNGRWYARPVVKNEVIMTIYSEGETKFIPVLDTRYASLVGSYHNAVKVFLRTGDPTYLDPCVGKVIYASDGTSYQLETDPYVLYEIKERQPEEEYFSIYRRG